MRRVVVTGMGMLTPLACGVKASWDRLINGESGILAFVDKALIATLSFETRGERITAIYQVYNPDKLAHVGQADHDIRIT